MLYKKAAQVKLRIQTCKGLLSVEDVWGLSLANLDSSIRSLAPALKNVQVDFGLTNGSSDESAIYVVITHLTFDSIESFQNIFPIHAEELLSDIPRFTNSRPQLQISEIII